jgi:hypothetical protein
MRSFWIAAPALAVGLVAVAPGPGVGAPKPPARPAAKVPSSPHMVPPFIVDDWPRALAEARERDLPVFVESWAPW